MMKKEIFFGGYVKLNERFNQLNIEKIKIETERNLLQKRVRELENDINILLQSKKNLDMNRQALLRNIETLNQRLVIKENELVTLRMRIRDPYHSLQRHGDSQISYSENTCSTNLYNNGSLKKRHHRIANAGLYFGEIEGEAKEHFGTPVRLARKVRTKTVSILSEKSEQSNIDITRPHFMLPISSSGPENLPDDGECYDSPMPKKAVRIDFTQKDDFSASQIRSHIVYGPIYFRFHRWVHHRNRFSKCNICNTCTICNNTLLVCQCCGLIVHNHCSIAIGNTNCAPRPTKINRHRLYNCWSLRELTNSCRPAIPFIILHAVHILERRELRDEGLYSIPGDEKSIERMHKQLIDKFGTILSRNGFADLACTDSIDPIIIGETVVFTLQLAANALFTVNCHKRVENAINALMDYGDVDQLENIIIEMEECNRHTLAYLCAHWQKVIAHQTSEDTNFVQESIITRLAPIVIGTAPNDDIISNQEEFYRKVFNGLICYVPHDFWLKLVEDSFSSLPSDVTGVIRPMTLLHNQPAPGVSKRSNAINYNMSRNYRTHPSTLQRALGIGTK